MPYKAFLSYSHVADSLFAPALQSALHRFARPFYRLRALQIFRDQTELSANPALWPSIEEALRESEWLILLASPGAARSPWVQREIETWLELHQGAVDRFLIVWTDGELVWDPVAGDFDWQRTTALPANLNGADGIPSRHSLQASFREEPFYLDLRWVRGATDLSLRNPRFLDDVATLAATLHGKPKSEMIGEDVQLHKRYRRARTTVIVLLALLALLATGFGIYAEQRRREAVRQTKIAVSRQLAMQSRILYEEQPDLALLLAIEARRSADTAEARASLLDAVTRSGRLLTILRGHTREVNSVEFSPVSQVLASASRDGTIRLWDVRVGRLLAPPLRAHTSGINQVAFRPDGRVLASASQNGIVQLWSVANHRPLGPPFKPHIGPRGIALKVMDLAFSPEGRTLATTSAFEATRFWDAVTLQPLGAIEGRSFIGPAGCLAYSPDGRSFVTCATKNQSLELWDTVTRRRVRTFAGNPSDMVFVGFSPDGRKLVTGGMDGVRLWHVGKSEPLGPPLPDQREGSHSIFAAAFSPDGRTIAAVGSDGFIRLWDAETRELLGRPFRGSPFRLSSLAFSPDGKTLATGGEDSMVRLWNLRSDQPLARRFEEEGGKKGIQIENMALSPNGRRLATSNGTGEVLMWDVESGRRFGPPLTGQHMAFNSSGSRLTTVDVTGRAVRIWDTATGRLVQQGAIDVHEPMDIDILFSPDGRRVISVQPDGASRVWDTATQKLVAQVPAKLKMPAFFAASSRNGAVLALASLNDPIQLWDTTAGRLLTKIELGRDVLCFSLALSPDGSRLAAGTLGGGILLWDTATRKLLGRIKTRPLVEGIFPQGKEIIVSGLAFSPDGNFLASGSEEAVRLWDVRTRQLLGELLGPRPGSEVIRNLSFSQDGRSLVAGGLLEEITVLDVDPISWQRHACRIANRNLTPDEWEQYLGGQPYDPKTCPEIP